MEEFLQFIGTVTLFFISAGGIYCIFKGLNWVFEYHTDIWWQAELLKKRVRELEIKVEELRTKKRKSDGR